MHKRFIRHMLTEKTNKQISPRKSYGPDHPAHSRSLIGAFTGHHRMYQWVDYARMRLSLGITYMCILRMFVYIVQSFANQALVHDCERLQTFRSIITVLGRWSRVFSNYSFNYERSWCRVGGR